MRNAILEFAKQFDFVPVIENASGVGRHSSFIVVGMGGSHLAADLLQRCNPALDIIVRHDYGLPSISASRLKKSLVIVSSYSGGTEEALAAYAQARKTGVLTLAIAVGGKLLNLVQKDKTPYIQLPDTGIEPRSALGFSFMAFLKATRATTTLAKCAKLSKTLHPKDYEYIGRDLAKQLKGYVPVIYASSQNYPLAYIWKIKLNETGKIPAFCNSLPEANHNEMSGFSGEGKSRQLAQNFHFIFLKDPEDDPRNIRRMELTQKLFRKRSVPAITLELEKRGTLSAMFSSIILADWTAYYMAKEYGMKPDGVPLVEEFKKMMAK